MTQTPDSLSYARYRWDEDRGDEYAHWGCSWWLFEYDIDGWVQRQIEKYDSGVCLKYDQVRIEDEFGKLAEGSLHECEPPHDAGLTRAEFEAEWGSGDHIFP